jgi:hypothetical protein
MEERELEGVVEGQGRLLREPVHGHELLNATTKIGAVRAV